MRFLPNVVVVAIAIVCVLAFSSVPALAANTGTINAIFNADNTGPQIISITPMSASVPCTPDGTTTLRFTVRCSDENGYQDLSRLEAQLYKGAIAGPLVTVTTNTPVPGNPKEADYTVNIEFQYYWLHGADYTVKFTLYDTAGLTDTKTSGVITYEPAAGITVEHAPVTLNFGQLTYGKTSVPPQPAVIHNSANTPISVGATAPDWKSSLSYGSPVPISSLYGGGNGAPPAFVPMPIAILATSGVGTFGSPGTPPAPITTSWYEVVPAKSPGFVLAGTYTTTITLTATSTG